VLWVKHENVNFTPGRITTDGWLPESANPTYAQCLEVAKRRAERVAEPAQEPTNIANKQLSELIGDRFSVVWNFKAPTSASTYIEFRCLPDTIDPRGPKGGR
jgi:hypothetical protein